MQTTKAGDGVFLVSCPKMLCLFFLTYTFVIPAGVSCRFAQPLADK